MGSHETKSGKTVDGAELKRWLTDVVASEIEEAGTLDDIDVPHAPEDFRGLLRWIAQKFVPDDPMALYFADGSSDGGIDIASISSSDHEFVLKVWQVGSVSIASLLGGKLARGSRKPEDDVLKLRKTLTADSQERIKKLNDTASDVVRTTNTARTLAQDSEDAPRVRIEVFPISLKYLTPDIREVVERLGAQASTEWSNNLETWKIHSISDIADLYEQHQYGGSHDDSPEEIRLQVDDNHCRAHPSAGPFFGFVSGYDLARAYRKYGPNLLDSNLRFSLGKTEVNKRIEDSLGKKAGVKWFHSINNGVVIACESCQVRNGQFQLRHPQLVNGGQTVHSIENVLRPLEEQPPEKRTKEDRELFDAIHKELRLCAKIVIANIGSQSADDIAIASNTQNRLSPRTLFSTQPAMSIIRRGLSEITPAWYFVTKDGEFEAVKRSKSLLKSKTGNKAKQDFITNGGIWRRVENETVGIAMLAFLGFFDNARASRIFEHRVFDRLFSQGLTDEGWKEVARAPIDWQSEKMTRFVAEDPFAPEQWLLASFLYQFWKTSTIPESKQLEIAFDAHGAQKADFREKYYEEDGWNYDDDAKEQVLANDDSIYWPERIAKSGYLVLVYQSMRLLSLAVGGPLTRAACKRILAWRQFDQAMAGERIDKIPDFRNGSLSDGPLTAIGRILHAACGQLWFKHRQQLRLTTTLHQDLIRAEWVHRMSEQVDSLGSELRDPRKRLALRLGGPADSSLGDTTVSSLLEMR